MNQPFAAEPGTGTDPDGEPLLPAKLSLPPVPPGHRIRPRLFELVTAGCRTQITAVVGPAGSGKTTLAAGWARAGAAAGPVVWLSVDRKDNVPAVFWRYLLHGLRRGVPDLAPALPAPDAPDPVGRSVLTRLATGLAQRDQPVVVVLDGVEAVTDRGIAADLDLLVRYSTPGLRLVVVGRTARLVPLHRYQLAGQLTEIGGPDLALTLAETTEILRAHGVPRAEEHAAGIQQDTEGWTTGVCLSALSLRPGVPYPAGHQAIARFLRTEVLDGLPARVRDLLLRTSILDEVPLDLADRLTGRYDARGGLDELVRANAFVQPLDDSRFRCPHLFREILVDELYAQHPQLVRRLHGQAARWYAEQHRYPEALRHAVRIDDWDYAANLATTRLGVAWLLSAPDAGPVRSILADLPDDQPGAATALLRSVLALVRYDTAAASAAVDRAEKAAAQEADDRSTALHLGIATARVVLGRLAGDVDAAEAAAVDLERLCEPGEPARALALANLGVAELWAGRYQAARARLGRAATEPGTGYPVHDSLAHLALLEVYEGRLHRAERYARESLAVADRAGYAPAAQIGAASAALAAVALYRNDVPAVSEHLARALASTGSRADPPTAAALALLRARVAQGQRDWRRALAAAEAARAGTARWRIPTDVKDLIEAAAIEAHLGLGDTGPARHCLDSMSEGPLRTLELGHLQVVAGEPEDARAVLSMLTRQHARPTTLLSATLALGRIAVAEGDLPAAGRALREALDLGRAEQLRRPFVEAGAWVRQLLRRHPDLAAEHGWLTPQTHRPRPDDRTAPVVEPLTARESEVLRRLTEALSTEDIAAALYLSVNTVKTHLKSIYRKLGTSDRSATARRARELNLLGPPGRGDR